MRTVKHQRYYEVLRREEARAANTGFTSTSTITLPSHLQTARIPTTQGTTTTAAVLPQQQQSTSNTSAGPSADVTLWDPITQLRISPTVVPLLRELDCSRHGLTALHPNLLRFVRLDSLVLDHNALRTIHLLLPRTEPEPWMASGTLMDETGTPPAALYGGCRLLTQLHANNNDLRDLSRDTDIPRLSLLAHLSLVNNELEELETGVLPALRRLRHLTYLDMRGNPLVDEPCYRLRCIAALRTLEVLDGLSVTDKERRAAADIRSGCTTATTSKVVPQCSSVQQAGKSVNARALGRRYVALQKSEAVKRATAVADAAEKAQDEEDGWTAFHAIWALSQVGMPLSAENWAVTDPSSASAAVLSRRSWSGDVRTSNGGKPPSRGGGASIGAGNTKKPRRQSSIGMSVAAAAVATSVDTTLTQDGAPSTGDGKPQRRVVEVPRECLLPPLSKSPSPPAAPMKTTSARDKEAPITSPLTATAPMSKIRVVHEGPFFRTLRGTSKAVSITAETTASSVLHSVSMSCADAGPAPERLVELRRALAASKDAVRLAHGPTPTTATALGSSTVSVDVDTLTAIQEHKYAMIPPPWEQGRALLQHTFTDSAASQKGAVASPLSRAAATGLGTVSPNTATQEVLTDLFVLLYNVYSPDELQALEIEYGTAELLRLLPVPAWAPTAPGAAAAASVHAGEERAVQPSSRLAAQHAMMALARPAASAVGGGSGGGTSAGTSASGRHPAATDRKRNSSAKRGSGSSSGAVTAGSALTTAVAAAASAAAAGGLAALPPSEAATAVLAAARVALAEDPQRVLAMLTRPYMAPVKPGATAMMGFGKAQDAGMAFSATSASASSVAHGAAVAGGGGGSSSASGAATHLPNNNNNGGNGAAAVETLSLLDAEVASRLLCPLGPYEGHVVGLLLTRLLNPSIPTPSATAASPVRGVKAEAVLKELMQLHGVTRTGDGGETTVRAATPPPPTNSSATTTTTTPASTATPESESGKRRGGRGAGGAGHAPSANAAAKAAAALDASKVAASPPPAPVPQLTLVTVLVALLFQPDFVRRRLAYWEGKLQHMTAAAAAAPPAAPTSLLSPNKVSSAASGEMGRAAPSTAAAAAPCKSTSSNVFLDAASPAAVRALPPSAALPATLARLFHRVQELKAHAICVTGVMDSSGDATRFVPPSQVLTGLRV